MIRPIFRGGRALAVLAVGLLLTGCAAKRAVSIDDIQVLAQPDANGNAAVAVDVVLISEPALGEQLVKLDAAEWFRRRAQIARDYPDGMQVLSWELVPGQSARVAVGRSAYDAVVFAAYSGPGDHRARLVQAAGDIRVVLQASDFILENATSVRR